MENNMMNVVMAGLVAGASASVESKDDAVLQDMQPGTQMSSDWQTAPLVGAESDLSAKTHRPTSEEAMLETLKIELSNSLEKYFVQIANKQQPAPAEISKMYLQSQVIGGTVPLSDYSKELDSIAKNLYPNQDDALAWVASVDRENNPWHYEPEAHGKTYGDTSKAAEEMDDVFVNTDVLGIRTNLSADQRQLLNKLNAQGERALSSIELTEIYAQLACDNFQANNDVTELCDGDIEAFKKMPIEEKQKLSGNLVINDGQGVMLDVSEMTVGQKTRLTGPVKSTDIDGKIAEEALLVKYYEQPFMQREPVSMQVCGGMLTYSGAETTFHFESSYLGEFDYDSNYFNLAYKTGTATVDGKEQEIAVPILKASNLEYDNVSKDAWFARWGRDDENSPKNPPKGLKVADYMFEGNDKLERQPPLPEGLISAHGMFSNCQNLRMVGTAGKTGEDDAWKFARWGNEYGDGGRVNNMPVSMQDTSYMFTNCGRLTETYEQLGEQVSDARGMYQGCADISVPLDTSNCKNLVVEYVADMYTGCNSDMNAAINGDAVQSEQQLDKDGNPVETTGGKAMNDALQSSLRAEGRQLSAWTEGGARDTNTARIMNGMDVTSGQREAWQKRIDVQKIIESSDPSGSGAVTGAEALSNGMVGYSVQKLANGATVIDDSTWAGLRDSYDAPVTSGGNEMLDRGLAFLGTMGISSAILGGVTKSKWIGLIGGAGIAAGLQVVGVADKLSPLLDSVGDMMGDSKLGQGLHNLADKLHGTSSQKVRDVMSVEQLFDDRQKATARYTEAILEPLTMKEYDGTMSVGFYQKCDATMKQNGQYLAQDGSLEVMAYTSEEEFKKSCNSAVMDTACDMMAHHIKTLAGSDGTLSDEQKAELNNCFATMVSNIQLYSIGAEEEIKAVPDTEKADRMHAGLGKVMRNTSEPVYNMICQMDEQYHILNDNTKQLLDKMVPYGTSKFSEYQASYDPTTCVGDIGKPPVDIYVENLRANVTASQQREALMKENGASQSELRKAMQHDMEVNYGWMTDIATAKGVQVAMPDSNDDMNENSVGSTVNSDGPSLG